MAPKKNNNANATSDTAQESTTNNNGGQQQQQNKNGKNTKNSSQPVGDGASQATSMRRSKRAGVVFPVSRIHRVLKERNTSKLVFNTAAVYMAGVLEYLVAEIAELAGNAAHDNKRHRITPRHIFLAIHNDEELNKVCEHVIIAEGGVMPNIHQVLLPSNTSSLSLKGDGTHGKTKKSKPKKQANTSATDTADSADDDDDIMQS